MSLLKVIVISPIWSCWTLYQTNVYHG